MISTLGKTLATAIPAFAVAIPLSLTTAQAADAIQRTLMVVDISGSSTFIADQISAAAAARYVESYIARLDHPHDLRMISMGDPGMAKRPIDIGATVTNRRASSARRLAAEYAGHFRNLPKAGLVEHGSTSLVEFFYSLEEICAKAKTQVIVFTDGIEWSTVVDGRAFVTGKATLPKPARGFLRGCRVEMHGVGNLRSTTSSSGLQHIAPQWRAFLEAAKADSVVVSGGLFDW